MSWKIIGKHSSNSTSLVAEDAIRSNKHVGFLCSCSQLRPKARAILLTLFSGPGESMMDVHRGPITPPPFNPLSQEYQPMSTDPRPATPNHSEGAAQLPFAVDASQLSTVYANFCRVTGTPEE